VYLLLFLGTVSLRAFGSLFAWWKDFMRRSPSRGHVVLVGASRATPPVALVKNATKAGSCVRMSHHEATLLPSLEATFAALFTDIAAARERIWIESFIVRSDRYGYRLAQHLAAARARGVDVRLLYDPLGSRATRPEYFASLRGRDIQVRAYKPWRLVLCGSAPWPRDHARVICIDDTGYTGGVAFGDEWLPHHEGGPGWHDVSCKLRGPVVSQFAEVFERRWMEAELPGHVRDLCFDEYPDLAFSADAPADKHGIYGVYRQCVGRARRRIWIENAYFFPPRRLLVDLRRAAQRGVDVQVIVPARSDVPLLEHGARGEYRRWLRHGMAVFEYLPGVAHAKFAVIDDDWSTIGSFNLNPSSLVSTNESNLFVRDPRFVAQLAEVFESDRAQSRRITHTELDHLPIRQRLLNTCLARAARMVEAGTWLLVGTARRFG
jgi:cardiolipin synthase